jgi:mRNA-degrading endonuclease RelE of RelBE toxin-antitoxin system
MSYRITITEDAERQFRALSARDRAILQAAIKPRLVDQPKAKTKATKLLRPNPLVQFELRAGKLRALHNVEVDKVAILIVGIKVGNKLVVEGAEFHGHQDHTLEPPAGKPGTDVK